jgi:hypothetical protein
MLLDPYSRHGVYLEEVDGKVPNLVLLEASAHGIDTGELQGGVASRKDTTDAMDAIRARPFRWTGAAQLQQLADERPADGCGHGAE